MNKTLISLKPSLNSENRSETDQHYQLACQFMSMNDFESAKTKFEEIKKGLLNNTIAATYPIPMIDDLIRRCQENIRIEIVRNTVTQDPAKALQLYHQYGILDMELYDTIYNAIRIMKAPHNTAKYKWWLTGALFLIILITLLYVLIPIIYIQ